MKVLATELPGVLLVEPNLFKDERGFFMESWQAKRYAEQGIDRPFVQDNLSYSVKGTLRGLHYQLRHPQAKLVQVISGCIFDVAVDIRRGSPYFGRWVGVELSGDNHRQLFIPEGFAHGFCVVSDTALFSYKCSDFYAPGDEGGVIYNDSSIAIDWPLREVLLSEKDRRYPPLGELGDDRLPRFQDAP